MKLLRVHIIAAETCGGLLDGLDLWLRRPDADYAVYDPLCLIGPNGAGKSQFLQVLAEIFQCLFHALDEKQERIEGNPDLQFELEYLIRPAPGQSPIRVRVARQAVGKHRPALVMQRREGYEWIDLDLAAPETRLLLPAKIVGYTSGDNETLSLPFLISRSGYADDVGRKALDEDSRKELIPDTRLMLIDYTTHLEVLVANLLLGDDAQRAALLKDANLKDLHSFRCVIQLAHPAAPKAPGRTSSQSKRKGIQLTAELERYIDNLRRCATCYMFDEKTETYIFDYWVNGATKEAFGFFWESALDLYSSFNKIAMLNDLALPKKTRDRIRRDTRTRRFASRLPEPPDEDKVFRFESVRFRAKDGSEVVDYVSLSDGEHQLGQLLGTLCMLSVPNVLFLLDEPESHFNPHWRVKFISHILDLPTTNGQRRDPSAAAEQECLLTTHSPFMPSDMARDRVFIFGKKNGKVVVRHPDIETYGTTFDTILEECFDVRPPISQVSRDRIDELMRSDNPEEIKAGLMELGDSVEKVFLVDRWQQLTRAK